MKTTQINLNQTIIVRLTDKGIQHYVDQWNSILPKKMHKSFNEVKSGLIDGGMKIQIHVFMDIFGGLGLRLGQYVRLNIELLTS